MSPSPDSFSALQQFEHELTRGLRERDTSSRQQLLGVFAILTLATGAAAVLGLVPVRGAVHVYLGVVVAVGGVSASVSTLSRFRRLGRRGQRKRKTATNSVPRFFDRTLRRLELASSSNAQFEQLRPRLREVGEQRLAGRGMRLDSQPARELLGDQAWALLTHARTGDKFDPGPQKRELRELLDALERI